MNLDNITDRIAVKSRLIAHGARLVRHNERAWHIGLDEWSTSREDALYQDLRLEVGVPMSVAIIIRPLSDVEPVSVLIDGYVVPLDRLERIEPGRFSQDREGVTPRATTCESCGVPNGHFGWCGRRTA